MALDDKLDPEPICVAGIEPESALDRAREMLLYTGADYLSYRSLRIIPASYAAIAGLAISTLTPVGIAGGLLLIAGIFLVERKGIRKVQKEATNFIAFDYWEKHRKP